MVKEMLFALLLCGAALGCASFSGGIDPATAEGLLVKGGLQVLTLKYTEGQPEKAAKLVAVIDDVVANLESPQTPAEIRQLIFDQIPWSKLDAAEQVGAINALDALVLVLEKYVPVYSVNVPVEDIKLVLGWVREVATIQVIE